MSLNTWYFRTHRSIFISEIWLKPAEWLKIWLYIIWNVNYQDSNLFPRWSNFFQYDEIARNCNCSYKTVENCLKFLKDRKQVGVKKKTRGVVLDVKNYELYQSNSDDDREQVGEQTGNRQETGSGTINKETNNSKKEIIETIDTNVSISQAIVPSTEKPLKINPWTQRIFEIIKSEVEAQWFIYDSHPDDRRRATNIAKRQADWWAFIKDSSEEKEENIIRQIIAFSNQTEFTKKIRSCYDFHEKWKSVANSMKEKAQNQPKPRGVSV